jgi:hypothetical protein
MGVTSILIGSSVASPRAPLAHTCCLNPWSTVNSAVQWHERGTTDPVGTGMTTLDHQLYAWLAEPDERRFERAFNGYFALAFPAVVRRLARLSRWDSAVLEELAQDVLLRFFDKVGRGRRGSADAVSAALERIRPLNLGRFHQRQVEIWTKEVGSFRDKAMGFRLDLEDEAGEAEWRETIQALGAHIPHLQRQGCHLLHSVQLELHWSRDGKTPKDHPSEVAAQLEDTEISDPATLEVIQHFVPEMVAKTAAALAAEAQHPGVIQFVEDTHFVIAVIPRLRVPTNGYLFQIAMTVYLDECKMRGRRKRGGHGVPGIGETPALNAELLSEHPVGVMTMTSDAGPPEIDAEHLDQGVPRPANGPSQYDLAGPADDPTQRYEDEEFLEKFYEYLRGPVDDAAEAYRAAQVTGRGLIERRRLESLTGKFDRMTSVLAMLGEGHTQEGTAERLGLSRNQVKYIVELAQVAYARFVKASLLTLANAPNIAGQSHAP